jgi:hypothetical protein
VGVVVAVAGQFGSDGRRGHREDITAAADIETPLEKTEEEESEMETASRGRKGIVGTTHRGPTCQYTPIYS